DASFENRPSRRRPSIESDRVAGGDLGIFRSGAIGSDDAVAFAVLPIDESEICAAEPYRALDEGLQYGLEVEGGATDDLEDLAGGGLLLERLGEVPVAILELLEEADVLDGDDRLGGECLEQADLLVRERSNLNPADQDRPDRLALAKERCGEGRAVTFE